MLSARGSGIPDIVLASIEKHVATTGIVFDDVFLIAEDQGGLLHDLVIARLQPWFGVPLAAA
jgi:hypothetical protein